MFLIKRYKIRSYEMGLYFRDREFRGMLEKGTHWFIDPLGKVAVDIVSRRETWLVHEKLDLIVKSGALGRPRRGPGPQGLRAGPRLDRQPVHARSGRRTVRVLDGPEEGRRRGPRRAEGALRARPVQGDRPLGDGRSGYLDVCTVKRDCAGVLFIDGRFVDMLAPGEYAFWKGPAEALVVEVDLRETMVDVGGQEIMTADKVTLRLNAVVTYKVVNPRQAVSQTDDSVRHSIAKRSLCCGA